MIGIARDVLSGYLTTRRWPRPSRRWFYFPTNARAQNNDSLLVRVSGRGLVARRQIAAALDGIAPSVYDMLNPMDDVLAMQIYPFEVTFWVAAFLGGLALVMTVSGIYGVMAYLVNQRTKEIGIRVALGAGTGDVVGMVVKQSARLTLIGIGAGVTMALLIAPVFRPSDRRGAPLRFRGVRRRGRSGDRNRRRGVHGSRPAGSADRSGDGLAVRLKRCVIPLLISQGCRTCAFPSRRSSAG